MGSSSAKSKVIDDNVVLSALDDIDPDVQILWDKLHLKTKQHLENFIGKE